MFRTHKWPEQVRLRELLASIGSCCFCSLVFSSFSVFSIGVWDTKVARAGENVKVASLVWFSVHGSSQSKEWCVNGGLI